MNEMAEKLRYYSEFCETVFNYVYFSIVKLDRLCYLEINIYPDPCNSNILGAFKFPRTITIYLRSLIDIYQNNNDIKVEIIDTIVHELFHSNQVIDNKKYTNNEEYCNKIEDSVEYKTAEYMISHKEELEKEFSINIESVLEYYDKCLLNNELYKIFNSETFLINLFRNSLIKYDHIKDIIKYIKLYSNIIITINDEAIIAKNNGKYINTEYLSNAFYFEALCYSEFMYKTSTSIYEKSSTLYIYIDFFDQLYTNIFYKE